MGARAPEAMEARCESWEAFGTTVVLRLRGDGDLSSARVAVEHELDAIDRACSRFRSDSELSNLNAAGGRLSSVSPLFTEALEVALRAAELTEGDVDPTVGRALELAGYDRDWRRLDLLGGELDPAHVDPAHVDPAHGDPAHGALERNIAVSATVRSGWRTIELDEESHTVRLPAGVSLDLGATAKAWAADRAAAAASEAGRDGALIGIGGDISTCGPAPGGGWPIRVTDDHRSDCSAPGQTISIRSGGLATSSTAVRRWTHAGQPMHHIIDPSTGVPACDSWRTVSVAAASCLDANIAATAALVRASRAAEWLERSGLPALLVDWGGRVRTVGDWPLGAWGP